IGRAAAHRADGCGWAAAGEGVRDALKTARTLDRKLFSGYPCSLEVSFTPSSPRTAEGAHVHHRTSRRTLLTATAATAVAAAAGMATAPGALASQGSAHSSHDS